MSMQFTARIPARSFGFESEHTVLGFEPTHIATPAARSITPDPEHLFEAEFFEEMRLWWEWDDTRSPLYISGPSGCGKTSTVLQFLARVHAPAVTVTCRRRTEKSDLIGQWGMDGSGGFAWFDGPAAVAWRYGCVLVINEFSLAPPEVWVAVNDLFEGDALYIERTGEIVPRHPNARVIITDNCRCAGAGFESAYLARNAQDTSTLERFWHIEAKWPAPEAETALLMRKTAAAASGIEPERHAAIVKGLLAFASRTRAEPKAANAISCSYGKPEAPAVRAVSPRVLIRFAQTLLTLLSQQAPVEDPVAMALNVAFANGCTREEAFALQQLAHFELAGLTGPRRTSKGRRAG